jgi:hypothetical protein
MIIGINGKIGSGKDTVGKIIQWLTKPEPDGQYIGFQTYDDYTLEKLSPFKIKKFAGKLKQIASLLTGIDVEKFEDQEFKKTSLGSEWNRLLYATLDDKNPLLSVMSVREFLQKLGTEAMREGLHTNVWVNALFADYTPTHYLIGAFDTKLTDGDPIYPNWIITDMRFPNEMEAVELRKGVTIKVVRPGTSVGTHPSETALDDAYFDHVISNDGTIEDLIEKVRQILTIERII